ncbi:SPOR domain-containing protein [Halopseudomonas sp.]|uniref:SPOR domain-containing protein n=1 Tax=Halopseudomonas sp. TaxID=2901191 RepID=UPI0030019449
MRSLFLFLLLLNVLYALWQWQIAGWQPSAGDEAPQKIVANTPVTGDDGPTSSQPESAPQSQPAAAERDEVPPALCVMLGTFSVRAEVDQLQQRLLAVDVPAELVTRAVVTTTDYWLVMAVAGGSQGALARLSLLQERGIDSFVITRGHLAGNLSLGVFSQQDYAAARQAQLEAEGYDVRIEAVEKTRDQFLLQVPPQARRLLDQAMLARLRKDFPAMQHRYQACDGVANTRNIP